VPRLPVQLVRTDIFPDRQGRLWSAFLNHNICPSAIHTVPLAMPSSCGSASNQVDIRY
jgi:hypothetical protein